MKTAYDRIGVDYSDLRKPDPRIARRIHAALGPASTVLNIGAGTGSYEPVDRQVTAIEPSAKMIRQRPATAAPAVQAHAEHLPFADDTFDAAMAILTIHHWADKAKGLAEMRRVTRGPAVLLTFDPSHRGCWLTDYIPQLVALDEAQMPPMDFYAAQLGPVEISPVPVPGVVRKPISIPGSGGAARPSGRWKAWSRVSPIWPPTSKAGPGGSATAICSISTSSTRAIVLSGQVKPAAGID